MAVRFDTTGEHYSRAIALGSQPAWTVTAWTKISVDTGTFATPWVIDNGTTSDYLSLKADGTGTLMRALTNDGGLLASREFTVGVWYFVAISISATAGFLKTRAESEETFTTASWVNSHALSAGNLRLGVWPDGTAYFNGCLAGVKLWTATLSEAEVEDESFAFEPVRSSDLFAYYRFTGPSTTDDSGNGNTLTGGTGASQEDDPSLTPPPPPPEITEGFEDATLDITITQGGNAAWTRTSTQAHTGSWSLRSGAITHSQTSDALVTVPDNAATVQFWYRVSSEASFDYFRFLLGASQQFEAAGTVGWTQSAEYDVSAVSTITFRYAKDGSQNIGEDAAYVDDIVFTLAETPVAVAESGSGADALAASAQVPLADAGSGDGALAVAAAAALADAASGADAAAVSASVALADAGSATEAFVGGRLIEVADSGAGVDAASVAVAVPLADAAAATETPAAGAALGLPEAAQAADALQAVEVTPIPVADAGAAADVLSVVELRDVGPVRRPRRVWSVRPPRRGVAARRPLGG